MLAMCFVYEELLLFRSRGEEARSWGGAYEQGTLDSCIRISNRNSNSTFSQQRYLTMSLPRSLYQDFMTCIDFHKMRLWWYLYHCLWNTLNRYLVPPQTC